MGRLFNQITTIIVSHVKNMPIFVHLLEMINSEGEVMVRGGDTDELNRVLETLQNKGGRIIDVKIDASFNESCSEVHRVYLVLYEAQEKITT
jgi:hypothetical protein